MTSLMSLLIYVNLLLVLAAVGVAFTHLRTGHPRHLRWARQLHLAAFGTLTLSMVALFWAFLASEFSIAYVRDFSATNTPTLYKLSGLWAGREGTLLLWTWTAVGVMGLEELRQKGKLEETPQRSRGRKGRGRSGRLAAAEPYVAAGGFYSYVRAIGLLFAGGLAAIQLTLDPFKPVEGAVPAQGYGLNPLLQTPWMAVHPPVTFIAFGLMTPVLAAGLAYLLTRHRQWVSVAMRWARWSWVWMGAGLLVGGYWAYVTLGWGGYWAWDPVETSNLLPWIGLTAFLHAGIMYRRRRSYSVLGPMLAALVVALVVLESFVTRGGIWISVHAFQSFEENSPLDRFTRVLNEDHSVLGFFLLLVATVGVTTALSLRALQRWPSPEPVQRKKLADYIDEDTTMYGALFSLLLILAVTLALLMLGVNGSVDPSIFNSRLGFFLIPVALCFIAAALYRWLEADSVLVVLSIVAAAALVGAGVGSQLSRADNANSMWLVGLGLPLLAGSVGALVYHLNRLRGKGFYPSLRRATPWVVHLGIAMLLVGYAATVSLSQKERAELRKGETMELAGYEVTLVDLRILPDPGGVGNRQEALLEVSKNGELVGIIAPARLDNGGTFITAEVFIQRQLHQDLYISLDNADLGSKTALVTVEEIPLINLVWLGSLLLMAAELTLMGLEWGPLRKRVSGFSRARAQKRGRSTKAPPGLPGPTSD